MSADDDLETLLCCAVLDIRARIEELAGTSEQTAASFACTFLGCAANAQRAVFLQIGDGAIITYGDNWSVMFEPEPHEYCNVTTFITDEDAMQRVRIKLIGKTPSCVVLTSDGLESLLVKPGSNLVHPPLLDHLKNELESEKVAGRSDNLAAILQNLLESTAVRSRTDDDVSIIALSMRGEA